MQMIREYKLMLIGAIAGALGGYLYWKYVGCLTGTCAITSSPWRSTLYFALMGALALGMFRRKPKADARIEHPE